MPHAPQNRVSSTIAQRSRNPAWRHKVLDGNRHVVRRMYIRRAPPEGAAFPSKGRNRTDLDDLQAPWTSDTRLVAWIRLPPHGQNSDFAITPTPSIPAKVSVHDNSRNRSAHVSLDL